MKTVFELIEANGLTLHGDIEHFAELVRADERDRAMRENAYVLAEREACAEIAEEGLIGHTIAKAIRARGQAKENT